jgi:capsular polysaccharide biosynthesis protein
MQESFNLIDFIRLLIRWRKPILIVCSIAAIGTFIVTDPHIMPPYYKSLCIIYPANPELTSSQDLFYSNAQTTMFGLSADADRVLQIAESSPIKLYMVDKFHLFQHYRIDSATEAYPKDAVLKEFEDNYSVKRNERGAIEISVEDQDKQLAADMANAATAEIDQMYKDVVNGNKEKILGIYQQKIDDNQNKIKLLTDSILKLRTKYNFFDGINKMSGNINATGSDSFQKAYEQIKMLEAEEQFTIKDLNLSSTDYSEYAASISKDVPTIYIIERAVPAERKSRPLRLLSAFGALLVSFLLTVICLAIITKYKSIKDQLQND